MDLRRSRSGEVADRDLGTIEQRRTGVFRERMIPVHLLASNNAELPHGKIVARDSQNEIVSHVYSTM
jgi:hypothetical protein